LDDAVHRIPLLPQADWIPTEAMGCGFVVPYLPDAQSGEEMPRISLNSLQSGTRDAKICAILQMSGSFLRIPMET